MVLYQQLIPCAGISILLLVVAIRQPCPFKAHLQGNAEAQGSEIQQGPSELHAEVVENFHLVAHGLCRLMALQPPLNPLPHPALQPKGSHGVVAQELTDVLHRLCLLLDHCHYFVDGFYVSVGEVLLWHWLEEKVTELVLVEGDSAVDHSVGSDEYEGGIRMVGGEGEVVQVARGRVDTLAESGEVNQLAGGLRLVVVVPVH